MRKYRKHRKYTRRFTKKKSPTQHSISVSAILIGLLPSIFIALTIIFLLSMRANSAGQPFRGLTITLPNLTGILEHFARTVHDISLSFWNGITSLQLPELSAPSVSLPNITTPNVTFTPDFSYGIPLVDLSTVFQGIIQFIFFPVNVWLISADIFLKTCLIILQIVIVLDPRPVFDHMVKGIADSILQIVIYLMFIIHTIVVKIQVFFHSLFAPLISFLQWTNQKINFNITASKYYLQQMSPIFNLLGASIHATLANMRQGFHSIFSILGMAGKSSISFSR